MSIRKEKWERSTLALWLSILKIGEIEIHSNHPSHCRRCYLLDSMAGQGLRTRGTSREKNKRATAVMAAATSARKKEHRCRRWRVLVAPGGRWLTRDDKVQTDFKVQATQVFVFAQRDRFWKVKSSIFEALAIELENPQCMSIIGANLQLIMV